MKLKELADRSKFKENNPKVTLPAKLDSVLNMENFPPLSTGEGSPLKESSDVGSESWVKIASKSKAVGDDNVVNDRSYVEC